MDQMPPNERYMTLQPEEDVPGWVGRFLTWLENHIIYKVNTRLNWLLSRVRDEYLELIPDGSVSDQDGNWRVIIVGDDLEFQRRFSGTWVFGGRFRGS